MEAPLTSNLLCFLGDVDHTLLQSGALQTWIKIVNCRCWLMRVTAEDAF